MENPSCTTLAGIIVLQRLLLALGSDYDKYRLSTLVLQKLDQARTQISNYQDKLHTRAKDIFKVKTQDVGNRTKTISVTDLLLRQLEGQCHTASQRQASSVHQVLTEDFDPDNWITTQHHLPMLEGVLACVAYLPVTVSSRPEDIARQDFNSCISDRVARYKRAADLARILLVSLRTDEGLADGLVWPNDLQRQAFYAGFPASHIALLNGDENAALSLWAQDLGAKSVDPLGRSLAHLAVMSGNTIFLRKLWQIDGSLQVQNDSLDLSLEATATILNDNLTFVVLQELIGPKSDSRVLALAVDIGNLTIIKTIVDNRLGRPPFTGLVNQAIQCDQREIVEIFLPHLEMHPHTQNDIDCLVDVARQYGCVEIAAMLIGLRPVRPTFQHALEDIGFTQSFLVGLQ